jgi:hypothetical protein
MRKFIGTVIVAGALLVAGTAAAGRTTSTEAITSHLAGRTVIIECDKSPDWWGHVQGLDTASGRWIPGSTIALDPRLCKVFAQGSDARMNGWTALAMLTLAHEVAHVRGEGNEVKAECYGLRHLARFARAFGFSSSEAAWIRKTAARAIDGEILKPGCSSL